MFYVRCSDGWASHACERFDLALRTILDLTRREIPSGAYWIERDGMKLTDSILVEVRHDLHA